MLKPKWKFKNLDPIWLITLLSLGFLVIRLDSHPALLAFITLAALIGSIGRLRSSWRPRLPWPQLIAVATTLALTLQLGLPFLPLPAAPLAHAATFDVTRFDDPAPDGCNAGDCSLREAIIAANANGENDVINLPEGVYNLTISSGGATEDAAASGDLDVTEANDLEIRGQGNGATIDASGLPVLGGADHRVFHILNGNVTLENVTLTGGNAVGTPNNNPSRGGGLYIEAVATVALVDATVTNNTAASFGGGLLNLGTLTLNRVTINGNVSQVGSGGGIRNQGTGTVNGTNVTISGNQAINAGGAGGAIRNFGDAQMTLTHATIVSNTATALGSAIRQSSTNPITLRNSIVANPITVTSCNVSGGGGITDGNNNLDEDNSCGIGALNVDPQLADLANNGGRTQTHALRSTSPALDAVLAGACNLANTDQRGRPRSIDIPNVNNGGPCDAGAYELQIPGILIDDVSLMEGNAGVTPMIFTLSLTDTQPADVQVEWTTNDGTATVADSDYVAGTNVTTIAVGNATQTITVDINGDTTVEPDETFVIDLLNNANLQWAFISDAQGQGTILTDDFPPLISIDDPSVIEGNSGQVDLIFTVQLSLAPGPGGATVDYNTVNGSAIAGVDYNTTSGTLTFGPTETSQTITVKVNGDAANEGDETLLIRLSAITGNAQFGDDEGLGTIIDDDGGALPGISIDDDSVTEGNTGTTNMAFAVRLSKTSAAPVTAPFTVLNGSAVLGEDYNASTTTSPVFFAVGTTVQTITIPIVGETVPEADETFQITLGVPAGATITDGQATGTIVNDDGPPPTLSIGDATSPEGNSGPTTMEFSVQLSAASIVQVSVDYATNNGTAISSTANDYDPATGTLIFAPGQTEQKIMVVINGDTLNEPDEIFTVMLSNPRNAVFADDQATGTITNDDAVQQGSGDDRRSDDDDDDEDVPAPPPPPPPAPAAPAAAPPAAPEPAPAAETAPLPVTTLPNTGVDGSRTTIPWLMVLGVGFGAMALVWEFQRRRRNSRQPLQAPTQLGQSTLLSQSGSNDADLEQKEDLVSDN